MTSVADLWISFHVKEVENRIWYICYWFKGNFLSIDSIYYCWTVALGSVLLKYAKIVPIFFIWKEKQMHY